MGERGFRFPWGRVQFHARLSACLHWQLITCAYPACNTRPAILIATLHAVTTSLANLCEELTQHHCRCLSSICTQPTPGSIFRDFTAWVVLSHQKLPMQGGTLKHASGVSVCIIHWRCLLVHVLLVELNSKSCHRPPHITKGMESVRQRPYNYQYSQTLVIYLCVWYLSYQRISF